MNVVPPVAIPVVFNAGTVNTESVKRDNTQRETVPPLSGSENSSAEKGIGSESDRVKTPGQNQQAVTYERPSLANGQLVNGQGNPDKDNGDDQSAGKESAQDRQQEQQQEQADKREIAELKKRDLEVRTHEQAHASVGGQYAGSPQYQYETGPDGRSYAVDGQVSIDVSKESDPEDTIRKAQQVKAAALAPAEPSPADLRVANEATQLAAEARREIAEEQAEQASLAFKQATAEPGQAEQVTNSPSQLSLDLDDIVKEIDGSPAPRSLDNSEAAVESAAVSQAAQSRDLEIAQRRTVIESFYQQATKPNEQGLQLSA
jgi:hypothetical protein